MTKVPDERRLHPATLLARTLETIPQAAGGMAGFGAVVAQVGLARVLMLAALGILLSAGVALLGWWRFRYVVGAGEIVIQSGILHRQRRVIPFDRVQDVAIEQGLLARLFGTAKVRIETGGSASDEGSLDSIAVSEAQDLRDRIRRWNAAAGPGPSESKAETAEPLLFAMPLGRVLLAGLFNFSLFFLAVLAALLQYAEPLIGDVWEQPERWIGPAETAAGRAGVAAALLVLTILLVLGLLSGIARTLAREYGFRLTRSEAGLRRRRGLFTLSEVVIPLRRVQAAVIETGLVSGALGWHQLRLQTLGAEQGGSGSQVAAPFATAEEVAQLLAELVLPLAPAGHAFRRSPARSIVRRSAVPLLLASLGAGAALLIEPWLGLPAGALFLLALAGPLRWVRHGYRIEGETLFVREGLLTQRLWIVPLASSQTISLIRAPLQRPLRLANLLVDTAGASALHHPRLVDLDEAEAARLWLRLRDLFRAAQARGQGPASEQKRLDLDAAHPHMPLVPNERSDPHES